MIRWGYRMTEKEQYCLHTDITGNCFIVSDDCKFGMFDKLERSQVIRVIEKLNEQDEEIQQFKKENKELQGKASSWKITASEEIMKQGDLVKENAQLKKEVLELRAEIGRLNHKKEREQPHWLKYKSSKGYISKVNQDVRFSGDDRNEFVYR